MYICLFLCFELVVGIILKCYFKMRNSVWNPRLMKNTLRAHKNTSAQISTRQLACKNNTYFDANAKLVLLAPTINWLVEWSQQIKFVSSHTSVRHLKRHQNGTKNGTRNGIGCVWNQTWFGAFDRVRLLLLLLFLYTRTFALRPW